MERYGGTQGTEAMALEPECAVAGGGTGLEEPMWQLGLSGGPEPFPDRPDEPDCIYYLRTGFCGYGNRCRYNHPRDRSAVMGTLRAWGVEYPERFGQPVCQYYMRTGMCKFGASCKYHHPRQGVGSSAGIALNVYGYPVRLGEKECSYYIKTGQCKFGITCKFHHPQPAGIHVPLPNNPTPRPGHLSVASGYPTMQSPSVPSSQQYGLLPGNWPVARPSMMPGSYVPGSYSPMLFPPGVVPVPGWTPYPAPANPVATLSTQPTAGAGSMYGMTKLPPRGPVYSAPNLSSTSVVAGPSNSTQKENVFPERPDQPECQYYLRTGDCKFGSSCKYHHPPEWNAARPNFSLSPMGLPLRPGAPLCSHYAQNGICKFGPSCKFDHPMGTLSYSPSASSLTDMPVAPYPVGSTSATFAPSSSSSDLRPELLSGPSREMSTTGSSSAPVVSIFSKSEPIQSRIQHSGQCSTSSTGGSSTTPGGELHTSR